MLIVLWLTALCCTVGAHKFKKYTQDDMRVIFDNLKAFSPGHIVYLPYPKGSRSSSEYPVDQSSTEYSSSEPSSSYSSSEPSFPIYSSPPPEDDEYTIEPTSDMPIDRKPEETSEQPEEDYKEHPGQVGSIRGIPGVNFPDYTDIPLTSFQCTDKAYMPGFYADMETGCQVFHVCWPHRRESFLCPVGTTFNQAVLACDYWYSSDCSLSPHYYDTNADSSHDEMDDEKNANLGSMIDILLDKDHPKPAETSSKDHSAYISETQAADLSYLMKFLPVKSRIVVYPETADSRSKIVAEASVGKTKERRVHKPKQATQEGGHKDWESKPDHQKPASVLELNEKHKVVEPSNEHHVRSSIDQSVRRIIDEVFDIAKKIVGETRGLIPIFEGDGEIEPVVKIKVLHEVVKPTVHVRSPLPLTKLNPLFITKPASMLKHKVVKNEKPVRPAVKVPKVWET